ncbi:MAG TPA: S8 family serine peptidase [Terriglobales bacterium]|nr:S8 family serine peptidase [Terriglobales bacterium]
MSTPLLPYRWTGRALLVVTLFISLAALAAQNEQVIIRSTGSRQQLKQKVLALGGTIHYEFKNVTAVSATVPRTSMAALNAVPEFKLRKTVTVSAPAPRAPKGFFKGVVKMNPAGKISYDRSTIINNAQKLPSDYLFNNTLINATALQAKGDLGQGIVVAIIDSGTANNPDVVPALAGTVIGGENFVPSDEDPVGSATSTLNGSHGTWVGTMIAGHVGFIFPNDDCLVQSLQLNAPDSVIDQGDGTSVIPMVGVAPAASIYALKVFPSDGSGAPDDRIIAAMDRVITIKKNFLDGQPSVPVSGTGTEDDPFIYDSLNIQVVNMSLGGPTEDAGRDIEDLLTQQLLEVGITLATSAGNAGPALLTVGSPATGLGGISSAAANIPAHERIFWDIAGTSSCAVGLGLLARPNDTLQTAYFSSRGPTADGRVGVDVTSAGFFNFVEGADGSLSLVAGTSFAAPAVAGAAALLDFAVPTANATQVRNAIVLGANPNLLGDKSTRLDQGHGYLDVNGALKLLRNHQAPSKLPAFPPFSGDVAANLVKFNLIPQTLKAGTPIHIAVNNMVPGQKREFLIQIGKDIGNVQVNLTGVTPQLPPDKQNQLFGDDIFFAVHQAKTSAHGEGDYPVATFANAPALFTIDGPEPGFMRVAFVGDWTNAGKVSATLTITATNKGGAKFDKYAKISEGELQTVPFTVPSGIGVVTFELTWNNDWSHYPTNDLDLIVVDPDGNLILDGATLNGRETATIFTPKAGDYTILVDGFNVFGKLHDDGSETGPQTDTYRLRVFEQ